MVADHVDTMLLDGAAPWLWRLGRIAYPLFALVAAVHLARGARPEAYAAGLLVLAVPTQPIYALAFPYGSTEASILVTLAIGAVLGPALARLGAWRHPLIAAALALAVLAPSLARTGVDFGLAGVLLPATALLALRRPWPDGPWLVGAIVALNASGWHPRGETAAMAAASAAAMVLCGGGLVVLLALRLAGRPRFLPRYALHGLYPLHLAVLAAWRAFA